MTPLVQASVTVSDLSDSPAPSHLQGNWQPPHPDTIACRLRMDHFFGVRGAIQGILKGGGAVISHSSLMIHLQNMSQKSPSSDTTCPSQVVGAIRQNSWYYYWSYLLYIMYAVKCWGPVYFDQADRYANEDQVSIFIFACWSKNEVGKVCACVCVWVGSVSSSEVQEDQFCWGRSLPQR